MKIVRGLAYGAVCVTAWDQYGQYYRRAPMSLRKRFRQSLDPEQLDVGTDLGDQNDDFNHVDDDGYDSPTPEPTPEPCPDGYDSTSTPDAYDDLDMHDDVEDPALGDEDEVLEAPAAVAPPSGPHPAIQGPVNNGIQGSVNNGIQGSVVHGDATLNVNSHHHHVPNHAPMAHQLPQAVWNPAMQQWVWSPSTPDGAVFVDAQEEGYPHHHHHHHHHHQYRSETGDENLLDAMQERRQIQPDEPLSDESKEDIYAQADNVKHAIKKLQNRATRYARQGRHTAVAELSDEVMRLKNMLVDNSRRPIEDGNGMSHQFDMAHEDSGGGYEDEPCDDDDVGDEEPAFLNRNYVALHKVGQRHSMYGVEESPQYDLKWYEGFSLVRVVGSFIAAVFFLVLFATPA